jgi:hypothetical protein
VFFKGLKYIISTCKELDDYTSGRDNEDINAEMAKSNYQLYQDGLKQYRQDLIERWCKEIKYKSRHGRKYFDTNNFILDDDEDTILFVIDGGQCQDFMPDSSIQYFKRYFEERGFNVVKSEKDFDNKCYLRIRWLD